MHIRILLNPTQITFEVTLLSSRSSVVDLALTYYSALQVFIKFIGKMYCFMCLAARLTNNKMVR